MTSRIPSTVIYRKLGEEIVMLNLESGLYFGLNQTGSEIWEMYLDGRENEEIVEAMALRYEMSKEQIRLHIGMLLTELKENGLIF